MNPVVLEATVIVNRRVCPLSADRERVFLLCAADEARQIRDDVETLTEIPCSIVGVLDPSRFSNAEEILNAITSLVPTIVVVSSEVAEDATVIAALTQVPLRIRDLTAFYDEYICKVPIRELESPAIPFDLRQVQHPFYGCLLRILDVSFSIVALLILVVILPLVWVGNLLGNRGHLFLAQERVGKGMKVFTIWKLRTTISSNATNQWTSPHVPRVTGFGRFLRATHLEELPQAWNILRGELSLVGPRPEEPHYVEQLSATIPFYSTRHLVTPGLTGWAQINHPWVSNHKDVYESLQYDFWYLRHQHLTLDLKIIACAVRRAFGLQRRWNRIR